MTTESAKDTKEEEKASYVLFSSESVSHTHEIYLGTSFDAPEKYTKIFHALQHAGDKDIFNFYLGSYGGRLDSGVQFVNKLRTTKARTRCIIESSCYSMGAIFPFACSETVMNPHTFLMFHDYSTGNGRQKGNEIIMSMENTSKMFRNLLEDVCGKILTSKEIVDICDGKDLYLDRAEVAKRMKSKEKK